MDTDDIFGFGGGRSYGMGGMHGNGGRVGASGGARMPRRQDPAVVHDLLVSLEDIYKGCTKKMKVTRKVLNPDGRTTRFEEKVLTITVKPGWKEGTKVTFPQEGDQHPNRIPADVVFIIKDVAHPHFKREGADIHYMAKISLRDALCGGSIKVPTLDGGTIPLELTETIKPNSTKRITGQGLPMPKQPTRRGDLIITFDIKFPDYLPAGTKEILRDCLPQ